MKHAYMIMAHNNKAQLKILLELLDDVNNEIYLHIDAKSDMTFDGLADCLKYSTLHPYKKIRLYWGHITQAKCQLFLLREAVKTYHDYYHLISGSDLPLMTNREIDHFFESIRGKQLINFDSDGMSENANCKYIHPMQPLIARCNRKKRPKYCSRLYRIDAHFVDIQKARGVVSGCGRGCNWNDITHDLAVDYLRHEKELVRKLRFAFSADESILQTYYRLYGSRWELYGTGREYEDTILRKIDWVRGNGASPYVWRLADYEELMSCGMLFARKFDWNIDKEIILKIRDTLTARMPDVSG